MKRRILSVVMALSLVLGLIPTLAPQAGAAEVSSGTCGENLTWTLDAEGTLTISGTGEMAKVNTFVEWEWHEIREDIKKVVFDPGITSIGREAFAQCDNLESVSIPSSVTSIGDNAFSTCLNLTSINIPTSVTCIGDGAFNSCLSLISIDIPASVTYIGEGAFSFCYGREQISIAAENPNFFVDSCGVLYDMERTTIKYVTAKRMPDSYVVPDGVTTIEPAAFADCDMLKKISFPDSLKTIGMYAFEGCESLERISLSLNVESVDLAPFWGCKNLKEISVDPNNPHFMNDESGALFNKEKTRLIQFPARNNWTEYVVPDTVVDIGDMAFFGCDTLEKVTLPCALEYLGGNAFVECYNLSRITIPGSVWSIAGSTFQDCSNLEEINIENGVESVEADFWGCERLKSIVIPSSVTAIYGSYKNRWSDSCSFLESIYFLGDAPTINEYNSDLAFPETATLYYIEGKSGWTTPTWNGYRTATWEGQEVTPGLDASTSKVIVTDRSPKSGTVSKNSVLTLKFNVPVRKGSGNIHFCTTTGLASASYLSISSDAVQVDGNTVTIDLSNARVMQGRGYSIAIDSGAFVSEADGTPFFGLKDKTAWLITIESDTAPPTGIDLKWAKTGKKKNDTSKPPIPNGTRAQYAALLCEWAEASGVGSITAENAEELLDCPVYLPVNDMKGRPAQLFDGGTTVQQVMEDILFLRCLRPYVMELDESLAKVEKSYLTSPSKGGLVFGLNQEVEIYKTALGWYGQISKYLGDRNEKSNLFLSVGAPLGYQKLLKVMSDSTGSYSKYAKPMIKAVLKTSELKGQVESLSSARDYDSFQEKTKTLKTLLDGEKAVYKAVAEEKYGGVLKFGIDTLTAHFAESGNKMLEDISSAWGDFKQVRTAVTLSMAAGSTIGMFPMVVELHNDLFQKSKESTQAFYFIGDYYIQDKYPAEYKAFYDEDTFLPKANEVRLLDAEYFLSAQDAITYNWVKYLEKGYELKNRETCRQMRYDLVNYTLLLRFAKSIDLDKAKEMLVRYLDAELHPAGSTTIYAKCPVRVEVYDQAGALVASLSSQDESIATCEYGTLYLLGENDETKCFVLDGAGYTAKIIPYDTGTMDLMLVETAEDGTQESAFYQDVGVSQGLTFTTGNGAKGLTVTGSEERTIEPEATIPVTDVSVSGKPGLALGETAQLTAVPLPTMATEREVTWSSSSEDVVTVDADGVVTAQSVGTAEITATTKNGTTGRLVLEVYRPVEELTADVDELVMTVGETFWPRLDVQPGAATHTSATWHSTDPIVAYVDESGWIQASAEGQAVLTASIDGVSTTITVTVEAAPLSVELYQSDTQGNRMRIDLANRSLKDIEGRLFLAFYDGARAVDIRTCTVSLEKGRSETLYVPMPTVPVDARYTVKAFVLGDDLVPIQASVDDVALGIVAH